MTASPPRTLLIAGCGYVGLALARRLAAQGWRVWGLRRNPDAARLITDAGAAPIIADLRRPEALASLPAADYVVSCQAASRSSPDYRATYVEGTRNLIAALAPQPPARFLWVSSTSVYGQQRGEWVDERTSPQPASAHGRALLEAESLALDAPFASIVLRLAGIYGPGKDRLGLLRDGTAPVASAAYLNQIHLDDVIGLIVWLLEQGRPGELYLGVDDEPVQKSRFYPWLAALAGVPLPDGGRAAEPSSGNKRCSNAKVKALGYRFRYPDYRVGFGAVLGRSPARSEPSRQ